MTRLPRDVEWLGGLLLPPEAAEVILGDLQEEAGTRFADGPSLRRALWLRWELVRGVAAVRTGARRSERRAASDGALHEGEHGRTARWLRSCGEDLGSAVRSLRRSPGFTLFAAGTLALGIGSATAVYSAVERVVVRPLPYSDADRMAVLWRTTDGTTIYTPEVRHVRAWRELDVFEEVGFYRAREATLTGRGDPEALRVKASSDGYFDLLGASPLLGRTFSAEEQRGEGARVAILSHDFWTRRFGRSEAVLGETLLLDDEPWTVVGVLPPRVYPPNSGPGLTDLWVPLGDPAGDVGVWPVTRLRSGVTLERANERLTALAEGAPAAGLGPPAEWRGKAFDAEDFGRTRVAETLGTLFTAAVLLLLVAAVNVSTLLLQRASARDEETAVRLALGAGRGRLLRQAMLESLLLALLGGAGGLLLTWAVLEVVTSWRPESMAWVLDGVRIHPPVLAFSLLVSLGAAVVAGALPMLRLLVRDGWSELLRTRRTGPGAGRAWTAWVLVAGEVGFSFALLTGTVLVVDALAELASRDPGFETAGLVTVEVTLPDWRYEEEAERRSAFQSMTRATESLPGVALAGVTDAVPPGLPGRIGRLHPEGRDAAEETSFLRIAEAPAGFLQILGQPLLAGRDLREGEGEDRSDPVLVGRSLAGRLFPELSPAQVVGRRFSFDEEGEPWTVVGVAADVRVNGLAHDATEPVLYLPRTSWGRRQLLAIRLEAGADARAWLESVTLRDRIAGVVPDAVVEVELAATAMADTLVQERFTALLVAGFAILALLLTAAGMYGVLSRAVVARTREIGIRMSLGADRRAVRTMVLGSGAGATLVGLLGGALLAFLGLRALSSQLFGLDAGRPGAYLLAAALLALVSLVATWLPARRATRLAPSIAMRTE